MKKKKIEIYLENIFLLIYFFLILKQIYYDISNLILIIFPYSLILAYLKIEQNKIIFLSLLNLLNKLKIKINIEKITNIYYQIILVIFTLLILLFLINNNLYKFYINNSGFIFFLMILFL